MAGILISAEDLAKGQNPLRGTYTSAQLEILGLRKPVTAEQLLSVIGRRIREEELTRFVMIRDKTKS